MNPILQRLKIRAAQKRPLASSSILNEPIVQLSRGDQVGTGTLITADGHILTSGHFLKNGTDNLIAHTNFGDKKLEVVKYDDGGKDIALLRFVDPVKTPFYNLAKKVPVVGTIIDLHGFDGSGQNKKINGKLKGYSTNGYLSADVLPEPGMSGGAMLSNGEVIGINAQQLDYKNQNTGNMKLGQTIGLDDIRKFLDQ